MRRVHVVAALVLISLVPAGALASIQAESRITRVTVHPDRADVTRTARLDLPAGFTRVELAGLPDALDGDSLRVSGRGVRAELGAVAIRSEASVAPASPERDAIDAALQALDSELAGLAADETVDAQLRSYLDAVRATAAASPGAASEGAVPDVAAHQRMLAFLREGYTSVTARGLERAERRAALGKRRDELLARRNELVIAAGTATRVVAVDIDASSPGRLDLELSYVVAGATWWPAYRADIDTERREVRLVTEAVLTQRTGEDWSGVALTLSTAAPARALEPMQLPSWVLGTNAVAASAMNGGNMLDVPTAAIDSFKLITSGFNAEYGEQSSGIAVAATIREAEVGGAPFTVTFAVPALTDVASDATEHRVSVTTDTLPAELVHRLVPSFQTAAYAVALTHAPKGQPLLVGPARVSVDGTFLGTFDLPATAPGVELRVPFGVDDRLRVTRTSQPRVDVVAGGGDERTVSFEYHTTIENRRDAPVKLALVERIPVAQDSRIAVKMGGRTTKGSVPVEARPGVLNWEIELAAGEKREVTLEYTVRHPLELAVAEL